MRSSQPAMALLAVMVIHHLSGNVFMSQLPKAAGRYGVKYLWMSSGCPELEVAAYVLSGRIYRAAGGATNVAFNATLERDYGDDDVTISVLAWMNGGWKSVAKRKLKNACEAVVRYASGSEIAKRLVVKYFNTTVENLKCPIKKDSYHITIPAEELTNLMQERFPIFFYGKFKMVYDNYDGQNKNACFSYIKEIIRES